MTVSEPSSSKRTLGAFEPLRDRLFRNIWLASLVSNFGILILGVGAAWEMTRLSSTPGPVALVQTALMLPMTLVAVPAGAIADMFDRRKVALTGLIFACICATILTLLSSFGLMTAGILLASCSLVVAGAAIYGPAWQASVREQVSAELLPAAVALNSISYNVARSFGPALGGVIVLVAGVRGAFAANAISFLPLIAAYLLWRRKPAPSRLPPERLDRAIVSGARYVIHTPPIRNVMIRALLIGIAGASIFALTPIVARDMIRGGAETYGLLLGFFGAGAVVGGLMISSLQERVGGEQVARLCTLALSSAMVVVGLSHSLVLTAAALLVAGACWMLLVALQNLAVQMSAPRWVTARALSWFQSSLTGGIALGAWLWGSIATDYGVGEALILSGLAMALTILAAWIVPLPHVSSRDAEPAEMAHEPEVALDLTTRSGPVVIELDYKVDPENARQFYGLMLEVQRFRQRNGAFEWSLARNIADPSMWTERYHCPTWGDYLRQRSRTTQSDLALQEKINGYRMPESSTHVRRLLERPFGSVRWRADTPDVGNVAEPIYTP